MKKIISKPVKTVLWAVPLTLAVSSAATLATRVILKRRKQILAGEDLWI